MNFYECNVCGLEFDKKLVREPVCPRCGSDDLWEQSKLKSELTEFDEIAQEMIAEHIANGDYEPWITRK